MNSWISNLLAVVAAGMISIPVGGCCAQSRAAEAVEFATATGCPHCRAVKTQVCHDHVTATEEPVCNCQAAPQATLSRDDKSDTRPPHADVVQVDAGQAVSGVGKISAVSSTLYAAGPSIQSLFCVWRN